MNKKIGFLLALMCGQQAVALEITKQLTAEEVAAEVIAASTLDEAKKMLDHCSMEERKLVIQSLQESLLQWVAVYGSRNAYAHMHDQKLGNSIVSGIASGILSGATAVIIGVLVYKISQAYKSTYQSAYAYNAMGKTTNDRWHGKSGLVNGVFITSPYCVDGEKLAILAHHLGDTLKNFESLEGYAKAAGFSALLALFSGIMANVSYDDASTMQHNLDRYDRIQALVAHLEK